MSIYDQQLAAPGPPPQMEGRGWVVPGRVYTTGEVPGCDTGIQHVVAFDT